VLTITLESDGNDEWKELPQTGRPDESRA